MWDTARIVWKTAVILSDGHARIDETPPSRRDLSRRRRHLQQRHSRLSRDDIGRLERRGKAA
jgi:hypothetical protein